MAQHDYVISNQSAAAMRADWNNALAAIVSQNSGPNQPNPTYAYQLWADTTAGQLKIRNAGNTAWMVIGTLADVGLGLLSRAGGAMSGALLQVAGTAAAPAAAFDGDPDTGWFRKAANQLGIATAGVERGWFSELGWNGPVTGAVTTPSINGGQLAGLRNRIINGAMAVDQRNTGAAQTITAGAALAYTADRWYGYCTGANVTGQRVQGARAGLFRYRFTGAASVTAIGFGQRIEQLNCAALAGTTATLSVDLANSVLTTVTWTAFYANTADAFGTLASPTRTQIATGTFTVNSTVTRYSTSISIPSVATTGIEIVFTVGAQTSGTWTIGDVQLEPGTVATPFERRSFGQELALCQRYYCIVPSATFGFPCPSTGGFATIQIYPFPQAMRVAPTVTRSYASTVNVTSNSNQSITTNYITDQIVGTSATNSTWVFNGTASAEL